MSDMQDEYDDIARKLRKLKTRLRQGAVLKYPPSAKSLEVVNQVVREQFPADQKRLLEEEKEKKLRSMKVAKAILNLERMMKADRKAKAKEGQPEWMVEAPEE